MKDLKMRTKSKGEALLQQPSRQSVPMDLSKEYADVNILRKAYELILENSDMFFMELEKSFNLERENRGSNFVI